MPGYCTRYGRAVGLRRARQLDPLETEKTIRTQLESKLLLRSGIFRRMQAHEGHTADILCIKGTNHAGIFTDRISLRINNRQMIGAIRSDDPRT